MIFSRRFLGIFLPLLVIGVFVILYISSMREERVVVPVFSDVAVLSDAGTPQTLSIPSIELESIVQDVGLTSEGNMGVPDNFEDVGWYRYGPEPGEIGNSVIAGHLDDARGNPAVFANLKDLHIGDEVFVVNSEGQRLKFVVREIRLVDYYNPPLEDIFGTTDMPRLNLITCDGTWQKDIRTYDKRLVVFTDFVGVVGETE